MGETATAALHSCGVCCFVLSLWGTVQLVVMGICYYVDSVTLVEDVLPEPAEYESVEEFVRIVRHNFAATARNCWIAAGIYVVLICVSLICIFSARRTANKRALKDIDTDDIFCNPEEVGKRLSLKNLKRNLSFKKL